jgi:hypothetical protein
VYAASLPALAWMADNGAKMSTPHTSHGLLVFSSLAEAFRAGFQIYDRTPTGYLVRTRMTSGWAFALVDTRQAELA